MKVGFLGGSFDPVHFGHLIAAQDVYEQYHFDRLFLVPAAQAPLKAQDMQSVTEDRLAMLRAACEWDHRLEIADYELNKGGVSYTIDSVRHFPVMSFFGLSVATSCHYCTSGRILISWRLWWSLFFSNGRGIRASRTPIFPVFACTAAMGI